MPPLSIVNSRAPVVAASWRLLREKGALRVFPAHGSLRTMEAR